MTHHRFVDGLLGVLLLAGPVAGQAAPSPVRRLDGAALALSPVTWLDAWPDGRLMIAQPLDARVLFFPGTASAATPFGRSGEGPGELRSVAGGGHRGDTAWVYDQRLGRVTLVLPGTPRRAEVRALPVALKAPAGGTGTLPTTITPVALRPSGWLALVSLGRMTAPLPWMVGAVPRGMAYLSIQQDGTLLRVLASWTAAGCTADVDVQGERAAIGVPFCARPLNAVSPGGERLVVALPQPSSAPWRVVVLSATGDTVGSFRPTAVPVTLSKGAVDSVIGEMAAKAPHPDLAAAVRKLPVPAHYPAWEQILVAPSGDVWLLQGGPDKREIRRWERFDRHGKALGPVVVPGNVRLRQLLDGVMWGTESDADGLESVVQYGIPAPRR